MQNFYFYVLIGIIVLFFIIDFFISYLNTTKWGEKLPETARDIYDEEKYISSQKYEKVKYKFSKISWIFSFLVTLSVLIFWGFGWLDEVLRNFIQNDILLTLSFFGVIIFIQTMMNLPFSYYQTFVIEEKFGFNKMTKKIFFLDTLKTLLLTAIIWWVILSGVVYLYGQFWENFWWMTWILLSWVSVFMMMFYTTYIVPIFNKLTPLEEGELKTSIQEFGNKVWFELNNIFVIDGSTRSSKANAYFSGFGPKKTIVLFDTLIKDMSTDEIVAVLAHEIGHYKRKHTLQMLVFWILQTGFILFIFSLLIANLQVAQALWAQMTSFHIWAVAFGILFTPVSFVLWIFGSMLSRKNEYEADEYAKDNFSGIFLAQALKKLAKNNLTNLTPHPVYEFIHYSHPTVLKRLQVLQK